MPLAEALNVDRIGEILPRGVRHQAAEGLLVEEVAPPADRLTQYEPGRDQVRQLPEGDLLPAGKDQRGDDAADDRAIDGDSALPDVQGADRVCCILIPLEDDVIDARADDGDGHRQERIVQHAIGVQALALGLAVDHDDRKHHGEGNQNSVPVNVAAKDGKRDRIRTKHGGFLLLHFFVKLPLQKRKGVNTL